MVIFNKKLKKYNEIQLTKNKMDLNIRKMTNHPPSPVANEVRVIGDTWHELPIKKRFEIPDVDLSTLYSDKSLYE